MYKQDEGRWSINLFLGTMFFLLAGLICGLVLNIMNAIEMQNPVTAMEKNNVEYIIYKNAFGYVMYSGEDSVYTLVATEVLESGATAVDVYSVNKNDDTSENMQMFENTATYLYKGIVTGCDSETYQLLPIVKEEEVK